MISGIRAVAALLVGLGPAACSFVSVGHPVTMPAQTAETSAGTVLTDHDGRTLYTFSQDAEGTSRCTGACTALWRPLLAPPGARPAGLYSIITRPDGQKQWAYDGKPLYTRADEEVSGNTPAVAVDGDWRVAHP